MSAPSPPPPQPPRSPGPDSSYTPSPLHAPGTVANEAIAGPHQATTIPGPTLVAPPVAAYSVQPRPMEYAAAPGLQGGPPPMIAPGPPLHPGAVYYSQPMGPGVGPQPVYMVRPTAIYYDANGQPVQYAVPPGSVPMPYGQPQAVYYPQQGAGHPGQHQVVYMVDGQPQVANAADPPVGQWRDDVFNCFENLAPSCLLSWCCSCVALGQIGNRLKDKWVKYQHVVPFFAVAYVLYFIFDYLGGQPGRRNMAAAAQVTAMLIGILLFIVAFYLRTQLRRRYSIPGDDCSDCITTFCCQCCVISQMMRHIFYYRTSCEDCPMGPDA